MGAAAVQLQSPETLVVQTSTQKDGEWEYSWLPVFQEPRERDSMQSQDVTWRQEQLS